MQGAKTGVRSAVAFKEVCAGCLHIFNSGSEEQIRSIYGLGNMHLLCWRALSCYLFRHFCSIGRQPCLTTSLCPLSTFICSTSRLGTTDVLLQMVNLVAIFDI